MFISCFPQSLCFFFEAYLRPHFQTHPFLSYPRISASNPSKSSIKSPQRSVNPGQNLTKGKNSMVIPWLTPHSQFVKCRVSCKLSQTDQELTISSNFSLLLNLPHYLTITSYINFQSVFHGCPPRQMLARIEFKLEEYLAYLDEVTQKNQQVTIIPWPIYPLVN